MALLITHLTTDVADDNFTVFTTASFTSTAGRPLLVGVDISDTNPAGQPVCAKTGCTFTPLGTVEYDAAGTRYSIFLLAADVASTSTGTMTITATEAVSGMGWTVSEVTGHDPVDLIEGVAATASGSSTTPAVNLTAFASVNNAAFAVIGVNADGSIVAGTNFAVLGTDQSSSASPARCIGSEWAINDNTVTATGPSGQWGIVAVEVKAAPVVAAAPFTPRPYGKPGVPETRVGLATRGGGSVLAMLPYSSLSYGRRLGDMSDCSVLVPTGDCTGSLGVALEAANPWEHELIVWRGTDEVWLGPLQGVVWTASGVEIRARDVFQWLEHRIMGRNGSASVNQDLAASFVGFGADGIGSDLPGPVNNDIGVDFRYVECGTTAAVFVNAQDMRYAADEMRGIAGTDVDWTVLGRTIWAGGEEFVAGIVSSAGHVWWQADGTVDFSALLSGDNLPVSPAAPLITEHVDQPRVERSPQVTYVVIKGAFAGQEGDEAFGASAIQPIGTAGGINDPTLGTVDLVETNSSIRDTTSATAAAIARKALYGGDQLICRWLVDSSVRFHHLVPGARVPVAVQVGCRFLGQTMRLVEVAVQIQGGDEVVTIRLGPVSSDG